MARPIATSLVLVTATWLSACAPQPQVQVTTATLGDMAAVRTYGWYPGADDIAGVYGSRIELASETLHASIDKGMRRNGFRPAADGKADVLVLYRLGVRSRREVNSVKSVQRNGEAVAVPDDVTIYRAGTLLIYLVDPTVNDVVWVGSASTEAKAADSDSEARNRLERAVRAVFDDMKDKPARPNPA
jgi:hypothetical protein